MRKTKQITEYSDLNGNGNDEAKKMLVQTFIDPALRQLLMTSIIGRGEIPKIAQILTMNRITDKSRYIYDENGHLTEHISLSKLYVENTLLLKISQGGKNREQLTYLAEQEMFGEEDDPDKKKLTRI